MRLLASLHGMVHFPKALYQTLDLGCLAPTTSVFRQHMWAAKQPPASRQGPRPPKL